MIKLIAIDLDGTLLDPERNLTPEVKKAIAKARAAGIKIVIATGRPLMGVSGILEELELLNHGDYVITYNGALVQRADTGEVLTEETLTEEDILDIDTAARKSGLHCHFISRKGIYTSNRDIGSYTVHEAELVQMPLFYRTASEISEIEIVKAMMIDKPEVLDNGIAYLPFEFFERFTLMKSAPYYLEIISRKASKGQALHHLAKKLYLEADEMMAIGDEENDRSMLEVAGISVVMANGKEDLKKIASHVTKTNAESGVAWAIEKWGLGDKK